MSIALHMTIMASGAVVLLIAGIIGTTDRGSRNLTLHKLLAGVGLLVVLAGFAGLAITHVLRPHLPHFYLALAALLFLLLVPVSGLLSLRAAPSKKAPLRRSHRADALLFYALAVLTVILGLLSRGSLR